MRYFSANSAQQVGTLAAAAITATTAATAILLLTANKPHRMMKLVNGTNYDLMITVDGVDWSPLISGMAEMWDLAQNGFDLLPNTVIGAYRLGSQPTTGSAYVVLL